MKWYDFNFRKRGEWDIGYGACKLVNKNELATG